MFNDESDRARRLQQLHEFSHKHYRGEQQLHRHRHDSSNSGDMAARRYEDSEAVTAKVNETGVIRKELDYLKQKYQGVRKDIDKWVVCEGYLKIDEFGERLEFRIREFPRVNSILLVTSFYTY